VFAHRHNRNGKAGKSRQALEAREFSFTIKPAVVIVCVFAAALVLALYWRNNQQKVALITGQVNERQEQVADSEQSRIEQAERVGQAELSEQSAIELSNSTPGTYPSGNEGLSTAIFVHISGAVYQPGVVSLPAGSRLIDGVNLCGGLSNDAASDYVNLAAPLLDGTHVHIPTQTDIDALRDQDVVPERELLAGNDLVGQATSQGSGATSGQGQQTNPGSQGAASDRNQSGFPVDINSADSATLQTVPGIGPVTAQRIIDYRNQHGSFDSLDDLLQVSGIGAKRLADMRPYLICK